MRKVNEDRVLDRPDRSLWAVADGMGGHRGGDIAADLAIAALRGLADAPAPITRAVILAALDQANAEILARGAEAGGVIGSTIVVLHVADGEAQIFWAGDSRAYRARNAAWEQLTSDHSLVQQLLDQGLIDRAQAARHPQGHVITRALGVESVVEVEAMSFAAEAGDILLLCSDGLSRSLRWEIPRELDLIDPRAADRILAEALENDGSDNISFVIVAAT
ncbi:PP2C family protein-serine/threonine phosphatase [Sphingomonas gei]|uniref:PP2C family protein-serine/threonine phosphatase n=1 Tax=Sphingomonas gei TaxID=1395960 RepID=UPI001F10820E|nr:protein phosphatase 2C domain-containing protein [Sphingomonas gei]